jgi:N-methylhydantoinase A/oxoprolinase/acetone carboxylase beta subunit
VPSNKADPVAAVEAGLAAIVAMTGIDRTAVNRFVHGTTVATNAVLTARGARLGLLATAGFEDVLEIGRQKRSRMYDLFLPPETPVFLAPRRRRVGIAERIAADGTILQPLDEDGVRQAVTQLIERQKIEALAVVYLFAFRNSQHERRTRDIVAEIAPGLPVSLSSEIDPAFREYERTCVTAFDAYVRPVMSRYVAGLASGLERARIQAPVEMMQSRGAVASAQRILERPVVSLLSGPAAGALGGAVAGSRAGHVNCITLDMGGTSTDIAVIQGGNLVATREGRIGGYPLRVHMVDVHTIGAGGGSIARLDDGGALKVGPESAEADPGPACYGRGGTAATITDASLTLGMLHAASFAGGIHLDRARAETALAPIARQLGGHQRAALGILKVCHEAMAEAIRSVTIRRGIDPRGFALVALGGAGPVHAGRIAQALGIRRIIVPLRPGVLAAEGLLHAPIEEERHTTFFYPATPAVEPSLRATLEDLAVQAHSNLAASGKMPLSVCVTLPTCATQGSLTSWMCLSISRARTLWQKPCGAFMRLTATPTAVPRRASRSSSSTCVLSPAARRKRPQSIAQPRLRAIRQSPHTASYPSHPMLRRRKRPYSLATPCPPTITWQARPSSSRATRPPWSIPARIAACTPQAPSF